MPSCYWLSVLYTRGSGLSTSSWHGSTYGEGLQDLVPLALVNDWTADGQAGTLGMTSLVGVELCWGTPLRVGHSKFVVPVVAEIRVSDCLTISPSARKRVTPEGNVDSLPSSSFMLNLTCFFGFPQMGWGPALLCPASGFPGS